MVISYLAYLGRVVRRQIFDFISRRLRPACGSGPGGLVRPHEGRGARRGAPRPGRRQRRSKACTFFPKWPARELWTNALKRSGESCGGEHSAAGLLISDNCQLSGVSWDFKPQGLRSPGSHRQFSWAPRSMALTDQLSLSIFRVMRSWLWTKAANSVPEWDLLHTLCALNAVPSG